MQETKETVAEAKARARRIKKEMLANPTKHEINLPTQIADGRNAWSYYVELGLNPQLEDGVFSGRCIPNNGRWIVAFSWVSWRWVLRIGRDVIGGFAGYTGNFVPNK